MDLQQAIGQADEHQLADHQAPCRRLEPGQVPETLQLPMPLFDIGAEAVEVAHAKRRPVLVGRDQQPAVLMTVGVDVARVHAGQRHRTVPPTRQARESSDQGSFPNAARVGR